MEGKLQTSFIPKKPLIENKRSNRSPMGFLGMIGWLIFFFTMALAGGLYAYNTWVLSESIKNLNDDLKKQVGSFDIATIDHITALDARLQSAKAILNSHLAVSKLLDLVASRTLQSVQFTKFNYIMSEAGKPALTLDGKAPNFSAVALQSDTFTREPYLSNQIFSNLTLDPAGSVVFKFNASVNPQVLKYSTVMNERVQPAVVPQSVQSPTSTSTAPAAVTASTSSTLLQNQPQ